VMIIKEKCEFQSPPPPLPAELPFVFLLMIYPLADCLSCAGV
jgi:hypothetical protein